ncbi:hypothetical protein [Haliscomenobacter sp.]|uniref:hypothetical protein n=1 Tax=Haliscomenobacter sp. TaxID=2717303 RepID=UPI003BA8CD4D
MQQVSFFQKLLTCFLTGLVLSAVFLVLGRTLPGSWVIPEVVFGLCGLSLLLGLVYPFIWQRKGRKFPESVGAELALWQGIIRYGLAFNISIFGFKKIFGQQFIVPYFMYDEKLSALSGEWLTWHYFGFSYPFGLIVAAFQIGGSVLLLFSRTRLLGVTLLLPVLLNILFINVFYGLNPGATMQSIILSLGLLYLLLLDYRRLLQFFLPASGASGRPVLSVAFRNNGLRFLMIFIPFALTFAAYYTDARSPNIRGTYLLKSTPSSDSTNADGGLTKIYFERDGLCCFVFGTNDKENCRYTYNGKNHAISIQFEGSYNGYGNITGQAFPSEDGRSLHLVGRLAGERLDLDLSKVH